MTYEIQKRNPIFLVTIYTFFSKTTTIYKHYVNHISFNKDIRVIVPNLRIYNLSITLCNIQTFS